MSRVTCHRRHRVNFHCIASYRGCGKIFMDLKRLGQNYNRPLHKFYYNSVVRLVKFVNYFLFVYLLTVPLLQDFTASWLLNKSSQRPDLPRIWSKKCSGRSRWIWIDPRSTIGKLAIAVGDTPVKLLSHILGPPFLSSRVCHSSFRL